MTYPKVYIILLNYNNWADTIECLESVLRNDYPNYQVIVVDNNSPNNSMKYLKAWAEGKLDVWVKPDNPLRNLSFPPVPKPIPYVYYTREEAEKCKNLDLEEKLKSNIPEGVTTKYPIVFIQSGNNLGFAGGNNVGIRYALIKNDFDSVILLNNDTVIKGDAISILVDARLELGEKAIYGGRIYYYSDPERLWYDGGKISEWTGRAFHLNFNKFKRDLENKCHIIQINFISFCFVLMPKFILQKVGLLDETYFMYVDDWDYCYKVWKLGYKLYHVINSEIWHKVGASSRKGEVSEFSVYWTIRNRIIFILKNLPFHQKISSFIFFIISRLIRFTFLLLNKKFILIKAQIYGIIDGIRKK
jgi:GT2 family glycosyltransferase